MTSDEKCYTLADGSCAGTGCTHDQPPVVVDLQSIRNQHIRTYHYTADDPCVSWGGCVLPALNELVALRQEAGRLRENSPEYHRVECIVCKQNDGGVYLHVSPRTCSERWAEERSALAGPQNMTMTNAALDAAASSELPISVEQPDEGVRRKP